MKNRIIVLNDNRCRNKKLECEHGLSFYIEFEDKKILFDAGQTNIFLNNAEKLGIDLKSLDAIILSHGDYDHGNGLKYLKTVTKTDLICHPDFMKHRISKHTGKFDGLNQTKTDLEQKFNLKLTREPYKISENIIFLGEIERNNDFEKGQNLPMIDEQGNTYQHFDDSGVTLKTPKGIVVISGCAHSGICNIIEYAKKVTNTANVLAAIGGFHLKRLNQQTIRTINYFVMNDIKYIFPAHCTSDTVCEEFIKTMPGCVEVLSSGSQIDLDKITKDD